MTLVQLRYFLAACRHGSFSAAAEALYLAPPSLAEQIRRLERELGVSLFVRSGRQLSLTEAGRTFLPRAEQVLAAVDSAAASVGQVRELRGGTASMGTFGVAHHFFVREVVTEFAARYPGVTIRMVGLNTVEVCDMIRRGELEAGLVATPPDTSGLDVRPIACDEYLYCVPAALAPAGPVTIEVLVETPLVLYGASFGWRDPIRAALRERARGIGEDVRPVIEVETLETALELAANGLGGTFTLRSITESRRFPAELVAIPFQPALRDTFCLVTRRDSELSPATDELVRMTEAQLRALGLDPPDTG